MGTTPKLAIPYVEPSDLLASFPAADKAQAQKIEDILSTGTWTPITAVGAGSILYRLMGALVSVSVNVSGLTIASGSVVVLNAVMLPAAARPSASVSARFGAEFQSPAVQGAVWIDSTGAINGRQQSGSNRGSVQGMFTYLAG